MAKSQGRARRDTEQDVLDGFSDWWTNVGQAWAAHVSPPGEQIKRLCEYAYLRGRLDQGERGMEALARAGRPVERAVEPRPASA